MINKAEAWQDQEIYYAVIDTPQGGIWRLFSFDCDLTKGEMIKQIIDYFPGALGVRSLDSWGTAYSLTPSLVERSTTTLNAIERQFRTVQLMDSKDKARMFRDLLNEMELTFERQLFSETGTLQDCVELSLYTEIKNARDLAYLLETANNC